MIRIHRNIGNFKADVFSPDKTFIGEINTVCELLDLRVQIKEEQIPGYYLITDSGVVVKIDRNGNLSEYPDEFDFSTDCLFKLI